MIPFNVPYVSQLSKRYALEVLDGNHQHGDGPFTARASKMISQLVGGGSVLLTPSCTHALEMASMLGNFGPGDEVILPSYTFTSAATAVTQFGATPVFVDIDPITKGIDANQVAEAVTNKTVAISWVNYAGVAPNIETLQNIAKERNLLLIEDNAHGLGGSYKGRPLGSFGDFATQSFHATKNIQCGEGGALVINNPKFLERAEIIREKGTDRSRFTRLEVKKYQWVDKGSSYLMPEVLAAILVGQLSEFDLIQRSRISSWNYYSSRLSKYVEDSAIQIMKLPPHSRNVAHMFFIQVANEALTERYINDFKNSGVNAHLHYQALGESVAGKKFARELRTCQETIHTSKTLIRLPLFSGMAENDLLRTAEVIIKKISERHEM